MAIKYRCFDVEVAPFGGAYCSLHNRRTGSRTYAPAAVGELLKHLDSFASLEDHGRDQCDRLERELDRSLTPEEIDAVGAQLKAFVEDGWLTSDREVHAEVVSRCAASGTAPEEPNEIEAVCIPTRNRPVSLKRALRSYIEHVQQYGRDPSFVVVDDSRLPSVQAQNLEVVRGLQAKYNASLYYASRQDRERYAGKLAAEAGVPADVVRFALLGDPACETSYGAARNSLVLLTAGACVLQADDDTVCRVSSAPGRRPGLTLSSDMVLEEFRFFNSRNEAVSSVDAEDIDLLQIHEMLLGRPVSD